MRKRAMGLSAAIFGSVIAGLALTAIPQTAVQADDCLTLPNGPAAPGGQWRSRTDPTTNRQCWYVQRDSRGIAPLASASTKPAGPSLRARLPQSVANARAEMAPAPDTAEPLSMANLVDGDMSAGVAAMAPAPGGGRSDSDAIGRGDGSFRLAEATPPNMIARHRPQPASARQAAHAAGGSIRTLLSALVGALALVGGASAVVIKFGGKAIGRNKKPGRERRIWRAPPRDDISSPVAAPIRSSDEVSMDWIRIARETQEANRQAEQIEQLLSRAARRSA